MNAVFDGALFRFDQLIDAAGHLTRVAGNVA